TLVLLRPRGHTDARYRQLLEEMKNARGDQLPDACERTVVPCLAYPPPPASRWSAPSPARLAVAAAGESVSPSALWGDLAAGPYAAGYRTVFLADRSRTWVT